MKTLFFVAAFIIAVLSVGSGSTTSAVTVRSLDMHSETESPPVVLVVNKDQFQGNWKQFKGDLKKQWGK